MAVSEWTDWMVDIFCALRCWCRSPALASTLLHPCTGGWGTCDCQYESKSSKPEGKCQKCLEHPLNS